MNKFSISIFVVVLVAVGYGNIIGGPSAFQHQNSFDQSEPADNISPDNPESNWKLCQIAMKTMDEELILLREQIAERMVFESGDTLKKTRGTQVEIMRRCVNTIMDNGGAQRQKPERIITPNSNFDKCLKDFRQFYNDIRGLQWIATERNIFQLAPKLDEAEVTYSEILISCVNNIMEEASFL